MNPSKVSETELRRRAAAHLASHPTKPTPLTAEEAVHELQVHQAELEMQNQELREAQAALARARDRYFSLFDLAPVAYLVFDANHHIAELNLAAAELLGKERAKLKAAPFFPYVATEYREEFHEHLNHAFATGQRKATELRLHREADGVRHIQLESLILPGELGASPLCLTACMDLTQRRQAEEALLESELRFRQLATATDQVFWIMSLEPEKVLYVNPAFATVWGRLPDEMYQNPRAWLDAVQPEDRDTVADVFQRHLDGSPIETGDLEYRVQRPDGTTRWILDSFRPIRDAKGRPIRLCGIARDITERKQAELERLDFERKLLETQKLESLGVMAGGIAHDFNNLLTGILGNAGLAKMDLDPGSPVMRSLEHIEVASQRAADLCKQMLAYSGRGRFVVEPLDLNQIIYETSHLMKFSISKKAILKQDLAPRLPLIMGDATQMRQVLMNLVMNASEAIGENTGFICVSTGSAKATSAELKDLHLSPDLPAGDYVTLEISDTGCGMTPEVLARIFDPFFTTKFTGRGLGLAAVLGIVRGHRGGIKVTSEPGRGSVFRICLPGLAPAATSSSTTRRRPSAWKATGTVLLVDDEDVVRSVGTRILNSFGLEVLAAVDGREGLALFHQHGPKISCVLLDLTMPHVSGEQAFAELRRMRPNVPVLLMSGFSEQEAVNRFSGKGLTGFLQKPFTPESVREKLQCVLEPAQTLA